MKLKKAKQWVYNKTNKNIYLPDMQVSITANRQVEVFSLNPLLLWANFRNSLIKGDLKKRLNKKELALLDSPYLDGKYSSYEHPLSDKPLDRKGRSAIGITKKDRDYIAEMEADFAPNTSEQEIMRVEKQKMIERLKMSKTDENGELFSDDIFDEPDY